MKAGKWELEQGFQILSRLGASFLAGTDSDEYLKEFEKKCRFSSFPPEEKLEEGLQIVKAAIFRRKIGNTSFQPDMLKTGTTPIDKETTK